MKKLLTLIFVAFAFYAEAQPVQADPNVIIGEDNTYADYFTLTATGDTLEIDGVGIASPGIKLNDYAGTGTRILGVGANGKLIRTTFEPGAGASFGTDNQIPYTNATADDFDYSSNFTFDGTTLTTSGSTTTELIHLTSTSDTKQIFNVSGQSYAMGISNDIADRFAINPGTTLNTTSSTFNGLMIFPTGNVYTRSSSGPGLVVRGNNGSTSAMQVVNEGNSTANEGIDITSGQSSGSGIAITLFDGDGTEMGNIGFGNSGGGVDAQYLAIAGKSGGDGLRVYGSGQTMAAGDGVVLAVNSLNSNLSKIVLQDNGTNRGYIAADNIYAFRVADAAGSNVLFNVFNSGAINVSSLPATGTVPVYHNGGTIGVQTSDRRLKNIVGEVDRKKSFSELVKITGYYYTEKDREGVKVGKEQKIGFMAQDFLESFPEVTYEFEENGVTYYGIDYSKVVVPLLAAFQEQQTQIEALTARIQALENK